MFLVTLLLTQVLRADPIPDSSALPDLDGYRPVGHGPCLSHQGLFFRRYTHNAVETLELCKSECDSALPCQSFFWSSTHKVCSLNVNRGATIDWASGASLNPGAAFSNTHAAADWVLADSVELHPAVAYELSLDATVRAQQEATLCYQKDVPDLMCQELQNSDVVGVPQGKAFCKSTGDPHILQFNGDEGHALVDGDYVLMMDQKMRVAARHWQNGHPKGVAGNNAVWIGGPVLGGDSIEYYARSDKDGYRPQAIVKFNGVVLEQGLDFLCPWLVNQGRVCSCEHKEGRLRIVFDNNYGIMLEEFDHFYGWMNVYLWAEYADARHVSEGGQVPDDAVKPSMNPIGMCNSVQSLGMFGDAYSTPYEHMRFGGALGAFGCPTSSQQSGGCRHMCDPFTVENDLFCRDSKGGQRRRIGPQMQTVLDNCDATLKADANTYCSPCAFLGTDSVKTCVFDACIAGQLSGADAQRGSCAQTRLQVLPALTDDEKNVVCGQAGKFYVGNPWYQCFTAAEYGAQGYEVVGAGECGSDTGAAQPARFDRYESTAGSLDWVVMMTMGKAACDAKPECGSITTNSWGHPNGLGLELNVDKGQTIAGLTGYTHQDGGANANHASVTTIAKPFTTCLRKINFVPAPSHPGYTLVGDGYCRNVANNGFDHYVDTAQGAVSEDGCRQVCDGNANCHSFSYDTSAQALHPHFGGCHLNVNSGFGMDLGKSGCTNNRACWKRFDGVDGTDAQATQVEARASTQCWRKDAFVAPTRTCANGHSIRGCCPSPTSMGQTLGRPAAHQCCSAGDPHIMQFDGEINHAMEEGDYYLYQSAEDSNLDRDLEIQIRHRNGSPTAAVAGNHAVAMSGKLLGHNVLEFYPQATRNGYRPNTLFYWNHQVVAHTDICAKLADYSCLCSATERRLVIRFDGNYFFIAAMWQPALGWMNMHLSVNRGVSNAQDIGTCAHTGHQNHFLADPYVLEKVRCADDLLHLDKANYCQTRRRTSDHILPGLPLPRRRKSVEDVLAECPTDLRKEAERACGGCDGLEGMTQSCVYDACAMGSIAGAIGTKTACKQVKINAAGSAAEKALLCEDGERFDQAAQECNLEGEESAEPEDEQNSLADSVWGVRTIMFVAAGSSLLALVCFAAGICLGKSSTRNAPKLPNTSLPRIQAETPRKSSWMDEDLDDLKKNGSTTV